MADIRINQLPLATGPTAPVGSDNIAIDGVTTRRATIKDVVEIGRPAASQAEAEAGVDPTKVMTPLTSRQAVDARIGEPNGLAGLDENGQLPSSMIPDFQFSNVQALISSDLNPGDVVTTLGYFDEFDGGGAQYKISEPETYAPIPDGVVPFVMTGSGQSNFVTYSGATGGVFPRNSNVYVWLSTTDGGTPSFIQDPDFENVTYYMPIAATPTYHAVGGGKSSAFLAASHAAQVITGRPVYMIPDGLGGRPISEWQGTGSVRYASWRANIIAGLAAIPGSPTKVNVALWQQGEADSAMSAATYQAALNQVYAQLSAETFWSSTTQFVAGLLNTANSSYANINAGIQAFAAENPSVRQVANTAGLEVEGDNVHFTGRAVYELGTDRYISALSGTGMPDAGSRILLENGLVAELEHGATIKGEWFGCLGGRESSLRLNALNRHAIETRAAFNSVTVTQEDYVTIKDPVVFGSGSFTSADMVQYHISLSGRIFVVGSGLLEEFPSRYGLTFAGFESSRLELPFFRGNYLCNCVRIAGYIRGIVSGGSVSRAYETAIDVSGTCSGTNFYTLRAYQRSGTDDQSLLTGYSLAVDTEDIAFFGGQFGIAKWPIWIHGTASGISFERIHVHNGSASASRSQTVIVMNETSGFNIRFDDCYLDNGYVIDMAGNLVMDNCFHLFISEWVTLTHPLTRVRVGSASARTGVITNHRGTLGYFTGTDYNSLVSVSGSTSFGSYGDAAWRVNLGRTQTYVPTLATGQTETTVEEYYQYNVGGQVPLRWTNRHSLGATTWDWDGDQFRTRTPGRGSATPGWFFGAAGQLGVSAVNNQTDLMLGSLSADRWRITDATGSLLPVADNSAQIGSTTNRPLRTFGVELRPGGGSVIWTSGAGTPEGSVSAPVGSLYTRTDGGANTTLYVKQSGTGNTGWAAK